MPAARRTTPVVTNSSSSCGSDRGEGGGPGGAGAGAGAAAPGAEHCRLPLGMQIIGRPLGEAAILRVAHELESRLDFASQVPERVREPRSEQFVR
ncbi:unnamed protein product [Ectocarpus fasciculatus]